LQKLLHTRERKEELIESAENLPTLKRDCGQSSVEIHESNSGIN